MSHPIPFALSWKNERRLSAQKEGEEEEKKQQLEPISASRKNRDNTRQAKRGHDEERGDNYLKAKVLCTVRQAAMLGDIEAVCTFPQTCPVIFACRLVIALISLPWG